MLEQPTIILLDNSLKMHGCNSDNHIFYELAGDYLMSMASDSKFVDYPPGWFSSLTIIRNSEVFKIKDKDDFINQVKYLSADLSIAFNDQVPIWKDVVNKITNKDTNVYILTSRVEKTVADWFYEHQINVGIIDLSKGIAERSGGWFDGDEQDKESIYDVVKLLKMQHIGQKNTVLDFGMVCIGDSPLQCMNTKEDTEISIRNIRVYGTAVISKVDGFPIAAVGKFRPTFETIYCIPENFENGELKIPRVPKNFNNLENFNNFFHTMDSMTVEANETVVFFGKAYCRETKKYLPVLLKSSSVYTPKVEEVPVEEPKVEEAEEKKEIPVQKEPENKENEAVNGVRPFSPSNSECDSFKRMKIGSLNGSETESAKDLTEDDNLSLDGWGEEESGLKRGPRYFEVQVLETTWREFRAFAKITGLLLSDDELYTLDDMYPGLVYDGDIAHHSADAMSLIVHRMVRALRKLPERTAIYQKETETMCKMIVMSQSKSYGLMFAKLLRRESDHFSYTHKHIANETAKHFVTLAIKFK